MATHKKMKSDEKLSHSHEIREKVPLEKVKNETMDDLEKEDSLEMENDESIELGNASADDIKEEAIDDIELLDNNENETDHESNESNSDAENDYQCYYCNEEFEREEELKVHKCEGTHTLNDEGNTWMG